jgi:hypothetical protein
MIIGVVGKKGSGKTTLANIAVSNGFTPVAFADPLKDIISQVFDISKSILNDPEAKENYQLSIELTNDVVSELLRTASEKYESVPMYTRNFALSNFQPAFITNPRQLLQVVGTDIFRNLVDKNYWLNSFIKNIDLQAKDIIVHDLRFQNELDLIKNKLYGKIVVIERPGIFTDFHESESFSPTNYDYKLLNNLSLEDFGRKCIKTLEALKKEELWAEVQKTKTRKNI